LRKSRERSRDRALAFMMLSVLSVAHI
jgi:hypothetical protein